MRIGWVISTQEGKDFLQAILNSERLDYYEIKALQIVIEFLYQKSKLLLLYYLLPLFMAQGASFFISIFLQELRDNQRKGEYEGMGEEALHRLTTFFIVIN